MIQRGLCSWNNERQLVPYCFRTFDRYEQRSLHALDECEAYISPIHITHGPFTFTAAPDQYVHPIEVPQLSSGGRRLKFECWFGI